MIECGGRDLIFLELRSTPGGQCLQNACGARRRQKHARVRPGSGGRCAVPSASSLFCPLFCFAPLTRLNIQEHLLLAACRQLFYSPPPHTHTISVFVPVQLTSSSLHFLSPSIWGAISITKTISNFRPAGHVQLIKLLLYTSAKILVHFKNFPTSLGSRV